MITVSVDGVQTPFDIVHTKILLPMPNPLTILEGLALLLNVPEPPTSVQIPLPLDGVFASRVVELDPHTV